MKKNRMMRAASLLLVAVLLTTCTISGTFAKYTTSGTATDSARVAKWGVTVTATGEDIFSETYANEVDDGETMTGAFINTVISSDDVVAPGTSKDKAVQFTFDGTPEVAVKVSYDAEITLTNWVADGVYCPIVFTVAGTPYTINPGESTADFADRVENAIRAVAPAYYAAGTPLADKDLDNALTVGWSWPFEGENAKDTILGNAAADANDTNNPSISISVTCTVDQVD